jgi:cell volume regulation protein A
MYAGLEALSWLSFLLLLGVILSFLAIKIKIPDILLLLITGMIIGSTGFFSFDRGFLTAFSIFALIMIIFDSTSKFKLKEFGRFSPIALKLVFVFLIFSLISLGFLTHIFFSENLFDIKWLILSFTFGALMCGTAPDVILSTLKEKKNKIAEILEFESILNTPLTILIPFITLEFYYGSVQAGVVVMKFLQGIMTGIGTGIFVGIIMIYLLKKNYQSLISPIAVIASALVSYTLAEMIGGNGVLSVTAFGVVFGSAILNEKAEINSFSAKFTNFLKIVMFLLLGLIIKIPFDLIFIIKSLILFGSYILIRYLAVEVAMYKSDLTNNEKLFMSLSISKGVAVAVMVFLLSSYLIEGMKTILDLSLLFILYSIITSSITVKFVDKFIKIKKTAYKK